MTPGPWALGGSWASVGPIMGLVGFRGPSREPMGFRGPIGMTSRNQDVEDGRTFFFWRSHQNLEKTVAFFPFVLEFTKPEIRNF